MRAGQLRHRITIIRKINEIDPESGGSQDNDLEIASVAAARKTINGDEKYLSGQVKSIANVEFLIYPNDRIKRKDQVVERRNGTDETYEVIDLMPFPENGRQEGLRVIARLIEVDQQ